MKLLLTKHTYVVLKVARLRLVGIISEVLWTNGGLAKSMNISGDRSTSRNNLLLTRNDL